MYFYYYCSETVSDSPALNLSCSTFETETRRSTKQQNGKINESLTKYLWSSWGERQTVKMWLWTLCLDLRKRWKITQLLLCFIKRSDLFGCRGVFFVAMVCWWPLFKNILIWHQVSVLTEIRKLMREGPIRLSGWNEANRRWNDGSRSNCSDSERSNKTMTWYFLDLHPDYEADRHHQ